MLGVPRFIVQGPENSGWLGPYSIWDSVMSTFNGQFYTDDPVGGKIETQEEALRIAARLNEQAAAHAKLHAENERRKQHLAMVRNILFWRPRELHPNLWQDGDAYLVRVLTTGGPEHYVIVANTDEESPVTFNNAHGDRWDEWDWDDVEAYIPLSTLNQRGVPDLFRELCAVTHGMYALVCSVTQGQELELREKWVPRLRELATRIEGMAVE